MISRPLPNFQTQFSKQKEEVGTSDNIALKQRYVTRDYLLLWLFLDQIIENSVLVSRPSLIISVDKKKTPAASVLSVSKLGILVDRFFAKTA